MVCKYYDLESFRCRIVGLIPSHPEYCRLSPDDCPIHKYASENGFERASSKFRREYRCL